MKARRRKGSILLPSSVIDLFYGLVDGFAGRLAEWGVRPNHITAAGLALSLVAAGAFALGAFGWGALIFAVAASGDAIDGLVARKSNAGSRAGAFLDSSLDRIGEAAAFFGLAIWGAGGLMTWLSFWALVASFTISYLRARGHSLGYDCADGLMQRPERLAVLVLAAALSVPIAALVEPTSAHPVYHGMLVGLGLVALLSTWTAFDRGRQIFRGLSSPVES